MDNPLALFSNKLCQGQAACEGELERLRADLDAEDRTQRGSAHLSVELRRLREKAEREHRRAVEELAARQTQRGSHQVAADSAGRRSDSPEKEPVHLRGRETYAKLEQFLETLTKKIDGERPIYKLHHRQGFEQEKAIFLCHLLKACRILLEDRRRAGRPSRSSRSVKTSSRTLPHRDAISSCPTGRLQTPSCRLLLQRPQRASHSPQKHSTHNQQEWPVGKALRPADPCLRPADPCLPAAASDTCRSSALKICHPPNAPHAGRTTRPPCCTEFRRSGASPPPRCTGRNMEVGYFIISESRDKL
ncbi:unnamed protein product [Tetraodon nigroviridis]|uniref:(spotted green pufferfish) hypothetical protein n=1 Tax=Tetraodon nigroviridis TaxID=99883 RepID=Q4SLF7_TETNG|nr:unnamed protein product [Tetraodon nigroviridis]